MPYIIHGQFQDVIDYSRLIKEKSEYTGPLVRVTRARKSSIVKNSTASKSNIKRLNIKKLSK